MGQLKSMDLREPGSHSATDASPRDRKSTRLNSSHVEISYAVFCLQQNIDCDQPAEPWYELAARVYDAIEKTCGPEAVCLDPGLSFFMMPRPPRSTLFPYTTLFR